MMEEPASVLDTPGEGDEPSYVSANGDADATLRDGTNSVQPTNFGVPGSIPTEGTRPRKKRGRHAKDPLAQSVYFQCSRLEDLETGLREYLANPTHPAEHTTLEFVFPVTAAFLIPAREVLGGGDPNDKKTPFTYSLFKKSAVSVVDALHNIADTKEQMVTQKRISKSLVDAISEIDGFHYSFHNHWMSNADQANRFSYYCNDSILNKGRAANEGLSKIRDSVKIRKPVYECEGGIWIKFSTTKNNLELHYKHIPMHPTFDERAPIPRNGSKRRRLMEIFHPEKLPTPKEKVKKDRPPKAPTKRKSTDDSNASSRKRRATEPIPRGNDALAPQNSEERENSLQPLFDFLGSAGQLEEVGADMSGGGTPVRMTDSAPPTLGESVTDAPSPGNATNAPTIRRQPYPGMMSGFMNNNEEIQWGDKTTSKKKRVRSPKGPQTGQDTTTVPAPTEGPSLPATIPQGNGPTLVPASSTEMDKLRRKLMEAEEKIRLLEGQTIQPQQISRPVNQQYQAPPPPPPFYPPPQHHSPPPGPWHHPSVYPYHPAYHYPAPQGPPAPPSVPVHGPPPLPAPSATHPHAYQQLPPLPPPVQSNAAPSYGFVPNPADIIASKIRPHLAGPQKQSIPNPVPIRQAPSLAHNHNYLSQLHQAASPPLQAESSVQSQPHGQSQPHVPGQPQLQSSALDVTENPAATRGPPETNQARAQHESHPQGSTNEPATQIQNGDAPPHRRAASQDTMHDSHADGHRKSYTSVEAISGAPLAVPPGASSETFTPVSARDGAGMDTASSL